MGSWLGGWYHVTKHHHDVVMMATRHYIPLPLARLRSDFLSFRSVSNKLFIQSDPHRVFLPCIIFGVGEASYLQLNFSRKASASINFSRRVAPF